MVDPELAANIRAELPGRRLDQQRQMKFFVTPGKQRLTEYEVLTLYSQQGTDWASGGFEIGDSMQKWPGGRATYAPETTEIKTTDWWRFRDPDARWFYPTVRNKAEEGKQNHRFMLTYSADGAIRMIESRWLTEILPRYYAAFLFNEYGLSNAHASPIHDCMSDIVRVFVSNLGFDKADAAQLIQTQRIFMHKLVPELAVDLDEPKQLWLSSPIYRGARAVVEALWEDTFDHIEVVWALHGVFEPLFGQYARRELWSRLAARFGDTLTPWFVGQIIGFHHYAAQGVRALCVDALLGDTEFGDLNRRWFHVWTRRWLTRTLVALRDLLGIYDLIEPIPGVTDAAGVRASVERVIDDWIENFATPIKLDVDRATLISCVLDPTGGGAPRPTGKAGVAPTPHDSAPLADERRESGGSGNAPHGLAARQR
jgi:methane monooxygenase component A beta chain